ncbi:hypothetical protein HYZ70_02950 [Candidatus Curtissbacteria bacterium]|nr:hypothetical protein [Candidatus Curtissbacteria bacterium]
MRDLSKIPIGRAVRRPDGSKKLTRLLVFLAVILAAAALGKSKLNLGTSSGSSVVVREAVRGLTPVALSGEHEELTEGAVDLVTQRAVLADVKYDGEARATAVRSFGGGTYILTVDATLPDPKNVSYQVWVTGGGEVVPIDYMRGEGTRWSLSVRTGDEFSLYDGIWITLERTKDEIPEEHVMEGSF